MPTVQMNGSGEEATARAAENRGTRRGLLGEILLREGLITAPQLEAALAVQHETEPGTPLGQILVQREAISQRQLNLVLDRYHKKYRLGDILVETEAITENQLQIALDHQKRTGLRLGDALLQLNFVDEEELNRALSKQFGITFVDLDRLVLDSSLAAVIDKQYAERHRVIPISHSDRVLVLAMDDPTELGVVTDVQARTGCKINIVTSTHAAFQRAFARTYGESPEAGLARRHEALIQAYEALRLQHEEAAAALAVLERAHDALVSERRTVTEALAEQRTRNEWNTQALGELTTAHEALRAEAEAGREAREGLQAEHAKTLETLAQLGQAYEALAGEQRAMTRALAEQRTRNEWNSQALETLRAAHDALLEEQQRSASEFETRYRAAMEDREFVVEQITVLLDRLKP